MFIVRALKQVIEITTCGEVAEIPFSKIADGCVGCLLVFETKDQAMEYAGPNGLIVEGEFRK